MVDGLREGKLISILPEVTLRGFSRSEIIDQVNSDPYLISGINNYTIYSCIYSVTLDLEPYPIQIKSFTIGGRKVDQSLIAAIP